MIVLPIVSPIVLPRTRKERIPPQLLLLYRKNELDYEYYPQKMVILVVVVVVAKEMKVLLPFQFQFLLLPLRGESSTS